MHKVKSQAHGRDSHQSIDREGAVLEAAMCSFEDVELSWWIRASENMIGEFLLSWARIWHWSAVTYSQHHDPTSNQA